MENKKDIVLLVDDEESILEVSKTILEAEEFEVLTANGVDSAIKVIQVKTPDLIISDVNMPGKSGYDFFHYVRSLREMQNIPFIFLTGNSDVESVKAGKEMGSDDYLTKPVDYYLLISTIKGKLKRKYQLHDSQKYQIEQIKNHLLRLISHEMRTPLTSILGATEILSDTNEHLSQGDLTTFLEMLQANSIRLTAMVDDFLLSTKIESGEVLNEVDVQETPLNPKHYLQQIAGKYENKLIAQNINLYNEAKDRIVNLKVYLPHVDNILHRLIDNAVKFSTSNSTITLSSIEEKDSITILVKDEGMGIPKEKLDFLFDKFQQVNRDQNEQQGTGLGLYIAFNLAKINKGSVWCESEEGKGSTFFVKFQKSI